MEWISSKLSTVPYLKQSSTKYCILAAVFLLCFHPEKHTLLIHFISGAHASELVLGLYLLEWERFILLTTLIYNISCTEAVVLKHIQSSVTLDLHLQLLLLQVGVGYEN